MEISIPHVVVRSFGSEAGVAVVSALGMHAVEVSDARDLSEMLRVLSGHPVTLVVIIDPQDTRAAIAEALAVSPGLPILIVSDAAQTDFPSRAAPAGWVEVIGSGQSLQNICWHVLEAICRIIRCPGNPDHPLGPRAIEVDERAIVLCDAQDTPRSPLKLECLRARQSFLAIVEPKDQSVLAAILERAPISEAVFCTMRLIGDEGVLQTVSVGVRSVGPGRIMLLVQSLILTGLIVGRHRNDRDPITGLLTRWAMSCALEAVNSFEATGDGEALFLLKVADLSAISAYIGHHHTDAVLIRVASAVNSLFPFPAISSRLMGDAFLTFAVEVEASECLRLGERLIEAVNGITVPGLPDDFSLRASVGVACVSSNDHDLAQRLAEAAAAEAQAAGGNRVVVAGSAEFTGNLGREFTRCMDSGNWEVWLQPVVKYGDSRVEFYETLARFDVGRRRMASRADYFIAGQAEGLLERFDQMMVQRVVEILESQPMMRLSVNMCYETFVSPAFPDWFLGRIRDVPRVCERIILEVAPRCMAAPPELVERRLRELADRGVAVALDDFGSGICRLKYLTQAPLSIVKLDELVTGYVDDDPLQREFVRTVVSLCRARGVLTVAEFTRSTDQLSRLVNDGVELFQGELFGMPRPATEVLAAMVSETACP